MDNPVKLTREEWLEEFRALEKEKQIYMKFEFVRGHIRATLSNLRASGKTTPFLQQQSTLDDPDAIELQLFLPEQGFADYEKRTGEANTACLSILYKIQTRDNLTLAERLHLSNTADLLSDAGS